MKTTVQRKPTKYSGLDAETCMRKYRRETWFTAGAAIVLVLLTAAIFLNHKQELSLWLYLVLIFMILLVYYASVFRRALGLFDVLYTDCDPVKFLEIFRGLQKKTKKPGARNLMYVYCALALCYLEDWDGVYRELAHFRPDRCRNRKYQYAHLNLLGDYCLVKDQREDFDACREQLVTLSGSEKAGDKKLADEILLIWDRRIACLKQDRKKERKILEHLLSRKKYLIQEVTWTFRLAQLDLLEGDRASAEERLQFVIRHGNTLAVKGQAQKMMEETGVVDHGNDTE